MSHQKGTITRGTVVDAQSTFEAAVAALASTFETNVNARQKAATINASRLVGELQVADAEALGDYWSDKIEADNTQFSTDVDTSVDWKSEDYSAQADAGGTKLFSAARLPFHRRHSEKARCCLGNKR